jgi:gluconokinase
MVRPLAARRASLRSADGLGLDRSAPPAYIMAMPLTRRTPWEPPLILALDVGTSSSRAALFDRRGVAVPGAAAQAPHRLSLTADGGAELDPRHLLATLGGAIDECLRRAGPRAREIRGVATSTFWHGLLGLDAGGRPLTPCYLWADTRSAGAAEELRGRLEEAAVHARTGCPLRYLYFPARLTWLRARDPRGFQAVRRWGGPWEYLALALFGRAVTSLSLASGTGLLDQARLAWDGALCEAVGTDAGRLFPLAGPDAPLEGLRPPFARRWRALAGVPWFPAIGDGACANVGSGCLSPRRVALTVGTSAALRVLTTDASGAPPPGLWRYRLDRRRVLVGGALNEGGNVVAWCRQTLRLPDGPETERRLRRLDADGHGLTVLPFWAGERSPGWNAGARATISGLGWGHEPLDILRAAMEAVAHRAALLYEPLRAFAEPEHEIVASGAALHASPAWCQILSDALGRPLRLAPGAEASSRGAALLGLEALGVPPAPGAAPAAGGRVFRPEPARHVRYALARGRQAALYDRICRAHSALTY